MEPFNVMMVYGTRPEAIKIAPVVHALRDDARFTVTLVSTGQHREMLDQVNVMFGLRPDVSMEVMRSGQSLNRIISRVLAGMEETLETVSPDVVLVQGDTSTAMAAALAAFNNRVRVVHLEAGLRTGNLLEPFPEEGNRKIIAQVTQLHLAPTTVAKRHLLAEQISAESVAVTGNTVIDALLEARSWQTKMSDPKLQAVLESGSGYVLVTTHRRENLDAMVEIASALRELAQKYPQMQFVLPLHLNPRIREAMEPQLRDQENVILGSPLPYDQFTRMLAGAKIVLTDSGGVQEEAPSLGVPVLVMRDHTERPEAVAAGTVRLVGTEQSRIVAAVSELLDDQAVYRNMASALNPYGDGHAAARVVAAIADLLGAGTRLPDFSPELSDTDGARPIAISG